MIRWIELVLGAVTLIAMLADRDWATVVGILAAGSLVASILYQIAFGRLMRRLYDESRVKRKPHGPVDPGLDREGE